MQIVKPEFEIWFPETQDDALRMLKRVERAGRVSYKSEDKITNDSYAKFIKGVVSKGHLSVIEHAFITGKFTVDRGVTHELVRHRLASYTQECVTGDTLVRKNTTIKDLFDRKNGSPQDRTHNKTIRLRSVNKSGEVVCNSFTDVFYKGVQPVYRVMTKLGYSINCTMNHKFKISDGSYTQLRNLSVGGQIFVNGRPALFELTDEDLRRMYLSEKMSPLEIVKETGAAYRYVLKRLVQMNIFVRRLNDKNKEKYNKGKTTASTEKMRKTIRRQYRSGRVVWNKGMKEGDNESVDRQAESLRLNHHNNGAGENNTCWKGGISRGLAQRTKENVVLCELCGQSSTDTKLEVHHIDKNPKNNTVKNLVKCCVACHNLLHHGWHVGTTQILDSIVSIDYIGKEDTYDLEMSAPYHNYVANGFIVHNSTRYCSYDANRFGKEIRVIEPDEIAADPRWHEVWNRTMQAEESGYMELLELGCPTQLSRSVLPTGLKSEIVVTTNAREWKWIFDVRTAKDAHPQIIQIMKVGLAKVYELLPVLFEDEMKAAQLL